MSQFVIRINFLVIALSCFLSTPTSASPPVIGVELDLIPALKRCFIHDNVNCFKDVLQYFEYMGKVEQIDLAQPQLPALAAQLGAVHIFKHLKTEFQLTPDHPNWNKWMTRAAIREQWTFVKTFQGADKVPSDLEVSHDDEAKKRMNLYRINFGTSLFPDEDRIFALQSLLMTRKKLEQLTGLRWHTIPGSPTFGWLNLSMVTHQKDLFPPVEQIRWALANSNEQQILKLKRKINEILRGGAYIMDDILPDPRIFSSLCLHYLEDDPQKINEGFVVFLGAAGAPVHDAALVLTPIKKVMELSGKPEDVCRRVRTIAILFASGSPINLLASELEYHTANPAQGIIASNSFKSFTANFLQPFVFGVLIPYLIKFPGDHATIQFFIDQGLDHSHTLEMYNMIHELQVRPRAAAKVIDLLSEEIAKKQGLAQS